MATVSREVASPDSVDSFSFRFWNDDILRKLNYLEMMKSSVHRRLIEASQPQHLGSEPSLSSTLTLVVVSSTCPLSIHRYSQRMRVRVSCAD